jgi:aminopeptidase N
MCVQDGENIMYGTGDDPFLRGVRMYLQNHKYNTSTSADLWEALSSAVGRNVGAWMHGWTFQKGYPLVHVSLGGVTNRDVFVLQVTALSGGCMCLLLWAEANSAA